MKKFAVFLGAVMLVFGVVGTVSAATFVEEYTGHQGCFEMQAYNFGFDFWHLNTGRGVSTDSSLQLSQDAEGAFGPWVSASLYIDFYSRDRENETAGIQLTAWRASAGTGEWFALGTVTFNGNRRNGTIYEYVYDFTAEQLAAFEAWGWGNVTISATPTPSGHRNNFAIKKAGIEINTAPVPIPSAGLLLGSGLLGLVGFGRKRLTKKA